MLSKNLLKAAMAKNDVNCTSLAKQLGISNVTLRSKMNGKSLFTVNEVDLIQAVLSLSVDELVDIFFAKKVS